MGEQEIRALLERVRSGKTAPEEAARLLSRTAYEDLGYAKVDHHRAARQGAGFLYGDFYAAKYRTNTGSATGLNRDYIEDREKTFQYEIRPYRRELGPIRYLYAWLTLHVRNSALIRKVYGRLFR